MPGWTEAHVIRDGPISAWKLVNKVEIDKPWCLEHVKLQTD
jgi:hypothetical protein